MELLYIADILYVSWDTQFGFELHWHREEKEIQIGYIYIVYG